MDQTLALPAWLILTWICFTGFAVCRWIDCWRDDMLRQIERKRIEHLMATAQDRADEAFANWTAMPEVRARKRDEALRVKASWRGKQNIDGYEWRDSVVGHIPQHVWPRITGLRTKRRSALRVLHRQRGRVVGKGKGA